MSERVLFTRVDVDTKSPWFMVALALVGASTLLQGAARRALRRTMRLSPLLPVSRRSA